MTRLADYVMIVGYTEKKSHEGAGGSGELLQRFPVKDWPDEPFMNNMEVFWQPLGWNLSPERKDPTFFMCVLTDTYGTRRFCSCLSFHEKWAVGQRKQVDEDEEVDRRVEGGRSLVEPLRPFQFKGDLYAPKVLCIASRLNLTDTFRYCLGTIYSAYVDRSQTRLEVLIGNLLGQVKVPPAGGPSIRFSIGRGDLQVIQPPLTPNIPITGTSVALLVQQIGINNLLRLFSAVMTEQKILFHSKSSSRLHDACGALSALMFPFKWLHTFIPLLPATLVEVVQSPTPFLIGLLSEAKDTITESLVDVIQVDLDGGSIYVPDVLSPKPYRPRAETEIELSKFGKKGSVTERSWRKLKEGKMEGDEDEFTPQMHSGGGDSCGISLVPDLPDSLWAEAFDLLTAVLHPELASCDHAFPPLAVKPSVPFQLDKEIRGIFMRLLAHLLQGYRSCLVLIRIHPNPVITFHKAKFLGARGLSSNQFVTNLLNCQGFNQFVTERGSPFRPVDLWDELYEAFHAQVEEEKRDPKALHQHLSELAEQLAENECPNGQHYAPKMARPPDWSQTRTNMSPFPPLDVDLVEDTIREGVSKQLDRYNSVSKRNQPKVVPFGPKVLQPLDQGLVVVNNSARRLEVLRTCIDQIFGNQIPLATKSIHAVKKALGSASAKLVLCEELRRHVSANVAMLDRQQFDLVVLLMQCALRGTSETDEEGVAAALLPLATSFCRKLCTGVIQFAYSCLQDFAVWRNQSFWEGAFYSDVQKDILSLYTPRMETSVYNNNHSPIYHIDKSVKGPSEVTALDIAGEQLRIAPTLDPSKLRELGVSDESTLYSQAMHYVNRMVYLLTPLDPPTKKERETHHNHHHHHHHHHGDNVSNITSVAESDSVGGESAFEDQDGLIETGVMVTRIVGRFVDKVCAEGGVTEEHLRSLTQMIPSVVEIHLETIEAVSRESKRLPPIPKSRIPSPHLLPGEDFVLEPLRVVLLTDGREAETLAGQTAIDAPTNLIKSPIPAEGALFFTNYRLIFKGTPADQTVPMQVVIRAFPLTSITKEKRFGVTDLGHKDQEGSLIRSATCQLLKLAFDEEVGGERIEIFRKTLHRLRFPPDMFQYFAFVGQTNLAGSPFQAAKDKNTTLKVFAKKTLLMTAKKVGVKPKGNLKKQKYVLKNWVAGGGGTLPPNTKYGGAGLGSPSGGNDGDEVSLGSRSSLSEVSDEECVQSVLSSTLSAPSSDTKTIERILERPYAKDWKRLGLGTTPRVPASSALTIINKAEAMRFSFANCMYGLCATYPALLVLPQAINDELLKKVAGGYNCGRVPVVTWRHPVTRALLLRGAAPNSRGLAVRVFGGQKAPGGGQSEGTPMDQENFLRAIMNATPSQSGRPSSILGIFESTMSLDTVLAAHPPDGSSHQNTPDMGRKGGTNPFYKAMDTLRHAGTGVGTSGGKSPPSKAWAPMKRVRKSLGKALPSTTPSLPFTNHPTIPRILETRESEGLTQSNRTPTLYIFMDKSRVKTLKSESWSKVEYIPVNPCPDIGKIRASFKQLLRGSIPSSHTTKTGENFLRAFERSEWLVHLQSVLRISGAVLDLLDLQGSSVMLCLGDGADITSQLSSLSQLCLDPYYRTLEGFNVLLEKEWLAFGHKFSERNNLSGIDGYKGGKELITPIFIQFLDLVHQIMRQFPLSFEFNQTYLKFLAYHSISSRFRTFLLDSEYERVMLGFVALDDKRGSLPRQYKGVDGGSDDETLYMGRPAGSPNGHCHNLGHSIFEYIDKVTAKSPIFFNFSYEKEAEIQVLRPVPEISNLVVWDYFVEENLGMASPYDLELLSTQESPTEEKEKEKAEEQAKTKDSRRVVCATVELPDKAIPDSFTHTLAEINRLESEMGLLHQSWKVKWEKVESIPVNQVTCPGGRYHRGRSTSLPLVGVRKVHSALHSKSTLDILLQGKLVRSSDISGTSSHHFTKRAFTALETCAVCSGFLFGKLAFQCDACGLCCHERCTEGITVCLGQEVPFGNPGLGIPVKYDEIQSGMSKSLQGTETYYKHFQSPVTEDRAYEGYLLKRGALLKGWRQRWFVLDSTKHQLRYYESPQDPHSKGFIDLSEVKRCGYPESPVPRDRPEDLCQFEIKTTRRVYNFAALNSEKATEWIEKIQGCLI